MKQSERPHFYAARRVKIVGLPGRFAGEHQARESFLENV
jgi:hypothetical protein